MILNSIVEVNSAKTYEVNIEFKNMMLNYRVEMFNEYITAIKGQQFVKLKNSEKKEIEKFIIKIFDK